MPGRERVVGQSLALVVHPCPGSGRDDQRPGSRAVNRPYFVDAARERSVVEPRSCAHASVRLGHVRLAASRDFDRVIGVVRDETLEVASHRGVAPFLADRLDRADIVRREKVCLRLPGDGPGRSEKLPVELRSTGVVGRWAGALYRYRRTLRVRSTDNGRRGTRGPPHPVHPGRGGTPHRLRRTVTRWPRRERASPLAPGTRSRSRPALPTPRSIH